MAATVEGQERPERQMHAANTAERGVAAQPSLGAGAQALTRKLSEAMLGLSGKERHAVLLPGAQPPSPEADAGNARALPCPSTHSSGRSGVVRPQARRTCSTSSGGKHPSPYKKQALAAAMSWQHASLSNKNAEGSATSDEDHPRLVPRRGAGPELRSSGREIDEYLMRLLHAGAVDASQDVTPPANGDHAGNADTVAFPAGWNTAKPWFVGARAISEDKEVVSPVQASHVKPVMPPPPFLSQPWQGSRLGRLPPVGPLAQQPIKARRAVGNSSVLAAGSEGTVGAVTQSIGRCPQGPAQPSLGQPAPAHSPVCAEAPKQQKQQQEDECQRPEDMPSKRRKIQGDLVDAQAETPAAAGQQQVEKDTASPLRPPPAIKTKPEAAQHQDAQSSQADEAIAQAMTSRVGMQGMSIIRDTLMSQQALFTEQVGDLHRILARQYVLMRCIGVPKEELPPAQQAQRIKREDVSGEGAADPRTVLVSHIGNGSGGSQPSTDQGSWPQVQSEIGRNTSLPSEMLKSAQQTPAAQQAQSVCHPVSDGGAAQQGYPQHNSSAAAPSALQAQQVPQAQQAQHMQRAQQAQHALQQDQAAAQELLSMSRQAPCQALPRPESCQVGQTTYPCLAGLSPTLEAGSGRLGRNSHIPTHQSATFLAGQTLPASTGQLGTAGADILSRAGSGPQASELRNLHEGVAAQLQQRAGSYPPPQSMQPAGPGISMAAQQHQQQQQSAAAWYAEFMRHMRVQQPANLAPYPGMWPWAYQSQMAAQAMNAAAMGLRAAPGEAGMTWQGAGIPGNAYGLQQAMAVQAAAQQQQQQAAGMQAQCNMSNVTPPAGASEDAASQESARESHQENSRSTM